MKFILFSVTSNLSDNLTEMCIVKNQYVRLRFADCMYHNHDHDYYHIGAEGAKAIVCCCPYYPLSNSRLGMQFLQMRTPVGVFCIITQMEGVV